MNTPPHHGSDILSPNVLTPRAEWPQQPQQANTPDRAGNLLSLLRFSSGTGAGVQPAPAAAPAPEQPRSPLVQETTSPHGRNVSASDLVASLFGKQPAAPPAPAAVPPPQPEGPSENTQEMLLRLLNRPQPGVSSAEAPTLVQASQQVPSHVVTIEPKETVAPATEASPRGPAKPETVAPPASKESMFTYVNPFEQLAAVSPRKKSPRPKSGDVTPEVEATQNQMTEVTADVESSRPPDVVVSRRRPKSPVLEENQRMAVNEVVGRLVGEIGRSLSSGGAVPDAEYDDDPLQVEAPQQVIGSVARHLRQTAPEARETADSKEPVVSTDQELEAAAAVEPSENEAAEALADSWESAEDSAEKEEERVVPVHSFPLRPFISITVKPQAGKLMAFRDDGIMDIARLKKEFDQLDRSLTAASSEYIVYALAKTGGIRIIRQDDGSDRQVFRSTRDRVFNVALCTSHSSTGRSNVQAILGIGVSGAVYWCLISRSDKDLFEMDALESESLIFPPFPASDENTSGGQLKTRAKRSSRHADLFAIGRGKNIYLVSPQAAMSASYGVSGTQRTVNTEKFFKERALKISTGKAGKDFAFSDDDSVIASLDKTGRLRFWDIRDVVDNPDFIDGPAPSEVRVPLNTFVTGSPAEKSWPTSVLFLDKHRAYTKTMALRYVLVGLKQNHTLQLWDIGLGKAVEELKFPHENESDAICSVAYHAPTGVIVVGHPTRNSIYFVHLSAPRYNLPAMTQADFIKAASDKESNSLPKPDSTACMSGIREISLGSKGQLRSLELLPISKPAGEKHGADETGLFELYVMHSRGVTCLNIKWEDLGLTPEQKAIRPLDALEEDRIEISDLQTFPSYVSDEPSVNGDTASIPSRVTVKEAAKKTDAFESTAGVVPSRHASPTKTVKKKAGEEQLEPVHVISGTEKAEKKKKKKAAASEATGKVKGATATAVAAEPSLSKDLSQESELLPSFTATMNMTQAAERSVPAELPSASATNGLSGNAFEKHLEALQNGVAAEFNKTLGREFEELHRRFNDERRSWETASNAKMSQVLRLVSSTLSDNVEKNLDRIILENIQTKVLPVVTDATTAAVTKQLGTAVDDELRKVLPKAINSAMQQPGVIQSLSDSVQKLAPRLESEVAKTVQSSIAPVLESLARHTKQIETSMERQFEMQIKRYEAQRQSDNAKLDGMATMLRDLSHTVASLAAIQNRPSEQSHAKRSSLGRVQAENIPRGTQQPVPQQPQSRPQSIPPQNPAASAPRPAPTTSEEAELAEIARLVGAGQFEEATIKWLQSTQQADLFDNFFVRVGPDFLTRLSAIVMLSVGVAVTSSLQTNVGQRLAWLKVVLNNVNPMVCFLRLPLNTIK